MYIAINIKMELTETEYWGGVWVAMVASFEHGNEK
jgi:hypothetical protein